MKSLFLLALLLTSAFFSKAQDHYDAALIPSVLKSRANTIIRVQNTTVDMQAPNDVLYRVKKAITILNKNGDEHAQLDLFYDRNIVVKSVKGEVYDEFGKVTGKFSLSDFRDESAVQGFSLFEDSRIKRYMPSANTFPYTIVYQYEIRFKQNLIIPDWTPKTDDDIAVEKSNYTFICKPNDQFEIKTQNYTGKVQENSSEKQKVLFWEVTNLPANKPEPYRPNPESYLTKIKIAPRNFSYFNYKGNYTNWKELGLWYQTTLLKDRDQLPPATIAMIKTLVEKETSAKEKARKIYQYLQEKTRYISVQIGIGGFQPTKASDVDRLGYGDCKGLVNYMQALLNVVGVESYYSVVQAGREKISLDPSYASINQGNHVILCLPLENDTTWLECTSQTTPFGYLGDFTDDRYVLAITPEGGKLLKTPNLPTSQNLQSRYAQLAVNEDGNIKGTVTTTFSGSQYENNEHIVHKPLLDQMKLLKRVYDVDQINFEQIVYKQQKTQLPVLTEQLNLNIPKYASKNADRLTLLLNVFNIQYPVVEVKNRTMPVHLNRGYKDVDTIVYDLPHDAVLLTEWDEKTLRNEFGEYTVKIRLEGNKLTYTRNLVLNSGTFPASRYDTFSQFIADIRGLDHLKLTFSLKK